MTVDRQSAIALPALFFAQHQTAGRGRNGRTWESTVGSLTFSVLVPRPVPVAHPDSGLISLAAADAICEFLESDLDLSARVKWPNDVYLKDRKLAGVLIESASMNRLVIGCGVNISNTVSRIPGATCLADWMAQPPGIVEVMAGIARRLIDRLRDFPENSPKIVAECRRRDWLAGKRVAWNGPDGRHQGTVAGIAGDGGLALTISGESSKRVVYTGSLQVLSHADTLVRVIPGATDLEPGRARHAIDGRDFAG